MNQKGKLLIGCALLVLLIAGSALLYQGLKKQYAPQNALITPSVSASEGASSQSASSPEASSASDAASVSSDDASSQEGQVIEAPDFTMLDGEGNEVTLSSLRGKPVVLNFWATWCPFCVEEMPHFQKLYEEMGDEVQFVMLNATDGRRETQEKAKDWIAKSGYTFPVYYDTTQEAFASYGLSGLPATFFIDAEGILVAGVPGMIDEEILQKGIWMAKSTL